MTTLDEVGDFVYTKFNQDVVKITSGKRYGIFHISDLIQPKCQRNVYYGKLDPLPRMDGETAKTFYRGNIVHHNSMLSNVSIHEEHIIYSPFEDKCYDYEESIKKYKDGDEFWYKVVIGTPDDILLMPNGKDHIIADKKTKLTKPETRLFGKEWDQIKDEHKSQLSMYRVLLEKAKGINAKFGCILSLDVGDGFQTPKPQPFELDDISKTRLTMIDLMSNMTKYLKGNLLPPRDVSKKNRWLCDKYCPYFSFCFDGENGKNLVNGKLV